MKQSKDSPPKKKRTLVSVRFWFLIIFAGVIFILISFFPKYLGLKESYEKEGSALATLKEKMADIIPEVPAIPPLDREAYDKKMLELANNPPDPIVYETIKTIETDANGKSVTKTSKVPVSPQPVVSHFWPVKTVYPNDGAILPFNRIVAYYGNLYSTKMGVLGEYPETEMLAKLETEVKKWEMADPETPAIPALHYIVVTAQGSPGSDGMYRFRMPEKEIDKVLAMAKKINAIVFLDIQVGFSTLQKELPPIEKYLKMPEVHLGLDPEFSMKTGIRPGKIVGTFDAKDINYAAEFLAKIVKENNLTPKILVIHRYTQKMVTNYQNIKPLQETQIVMDMDGWGPKAKKKGTYRQFIYPEPVQFAGFKIFYKNDIFDEEATLFTPKELLELNPRPIYIQYQ